MFTTISLKMEFSAVSRASRLSIGTHVIFMQTHEWQCGPQIFGNLDFFWRLYSNRGFYTAAAVFVAHFHPFSILDLELQINKPIDRYKFIKSNPLCECTAFQTNLTFFAYFGSFTFFFVLLPHCRHSWFNEVVFPYATIFSFCHLKWPMGKTLNGREKLNEMRKYLIPTKGPNRTYFYYCLCCS